MSLYDQSYLNRNGHDVNFTHHLAEAPLEVVRGTVRLTFVVIIYILSDHHVVALGRLIGVIGTRSDCVRLACQLLPLDSSVDVVAVLAHGRALEVAEQIGWTGAEQILDVVDGNEAARRPLCDIRGEFDLLLHGIFGQAEIGVTPMVGLVATTRPEHARAQVRVRHADCELCAHCAAHLVPKLQTRLVQAIGAGE